jgi:HK97 family phage prohead protease
MPAFQVVIPLQKDANNSLTGIASSGSKDRDDEKMSDQALKMMVTDIKKQGVNLFGNHEHNWENTLGFIKDASLVGDQVKIQVDLDDPLTNPKIPMLLNKLKKGIRLGLSVGGNVVDYKWEYDKELGKKIKVLDKVKIYEVSVVGIPSNPDGIVDLPVAIAKSIRAIPVLKECPNCWNKTYEGRCELCLTQLRR